MRFSYRLIPIFLILLLLPLSSQTISGESEEQSSVSPDQSLPTINEVSRVVNGEADNVNMEAYGDYLFVADGPGGFKVVNASDPAQPEIVYRYNISYSGGVMWDLTIAGQYLYVVNHDLLQIFDITDPALPMMVSNSTTNEHMEIEVYNNHVFMTGYFNNFDIYDVSNPISPVSVFNNGSYFMSMAINGNDLFLADYQDDLYVYDISTPSSPVVTNSTTLPNQGYDMTVNNNMLFVSVAYTGIEIFDISLSELAKNTSISYISTYRGTRVHASGDVLMYTGSGSTRTAYNISDLPNVSTYSSFPYQNGYSSFLINNSKLYIGSEDTGDITILDLSDLTNVQPLGKIKDINDEFIDVELNGDIAFWASTYEGMYIYNVSDPSSVKLLSFYEIADGEEIVDLSYHNDTIYLVTTNTIQIVDVSDLLVPMYLGDMPCGIMTSEEIAIIQDMLFMSCSSSIEAYNITDPGSPNLLGTYSPAEPNSFEFLQVHNNYLFAVSDSAEIEIIDFSVIGSMTNITYLNLAYGVYDIEFNGDHFYLATTGLNSIIVDIDFSDPANLVVTEYDEHEPGADLLYYEGYILSPDTFGLEIFQFNSSGYPVNLDYWSYNLETFSVTVKNYEMALNADHLFISTVEGGIIVENWIIASSDDDDGSSSGGGGGGGGGSPPPGDDDSSSENDDPDDTNSSSTPPPADDDPSFSLAPPLFWLVTAALLTTYMVRRWRSSKLV